MTDSMQELLHFLFDSTPRSHRQVELSSERAFFGIDKDIRVLLFRIVQELPFSVAKHAGAEQADVDLREDDGTLLIWYGPVMKAGALSLERGE